MRLNHARKIKIRRFANKGVQRQGESAASQRSQQSNPQDFEPLRQCAKPAAIILEARLEPSSSASRRLLQLQSLIGNRALAALLMASSERVPSPHGFAVAESASVQRWGAEEHRLLGEKGSSHRTVKLADDYELPFGEVVALAGDHFENIDQMRRFARNTKGGPGSRAEIEYALEWKLK